MSSKATIYTFLVIGLLVTLALIVAPVAYAISLSFYKLDSFVGHAKWVGFENYAAILKLPEFWRALWNGVVYSLGSIVLQVVLGIGFALILNETFPGRNFVRGLSILPYLLPTVVVILTFKWMVDGSIGIITKAIAAMGLPPVNWFESSGAAMSSTILVSVWMWTPFVMLLCLSGLKAIPDYLYEAASNDRGSALFPYHPADAEADPDGGRAVARYLDVQQVRRDLVADQGRPCRLDRKPRNPVVSPRFQSVRHRGRCRHRHDLVRDPLRRRIFLFSNIPVGG